MVSLLLRVIILKETNTLVVTQLTHDVSGIIFQDPKAFYAFGHTTSKTTWSLTAANQVDESSLASHLGGDRA